MNQLGFVVVYLGFAYALIALVFAWGAVRRPRRSAGRDVETAVVAMAAVGVLVAFALPSVSGFPEGSASAWESLDPLSSATSALLTLTIVVYAFRPGSGGDSRAQIVASMAASLTALVGGNLLIQATTETGTQPEIGLWVASGSATVALLVGLVGMREVEPQTTARR